MNNLPSDRFTVTLSGLGKPTISASMVEPEIKFQVRISAAAQTVAASSSANTGPILPFVNTIRSGEVTPVIAGFRDSGRGSTRPLLLRNACCICQLKCNRSSLSARLLPVRMRLVVAMSIPDKVVNRIHCRAGIGQHPVHRSFRWKVYWACLKDHAPSDAPALALYRSLASR